MDSIEEATLGRAREILGRSRRVTVLTGAGVSAESGVPTFRGADGIWQGRRVFDIATPGAFERDPEAVWEFYRWRIRELERVRPNAGHRALVDLEERCDAFWLITQNVDGLHRAAGSGNVIELHGSLAEARCRVCAFRCPAQDLPDGRRPACPACGDLLRPAVVWFGEELPAAVMAEAWRAICDCDVMLVIGTSGVVEPAASFASWASGRGAVVLEVNLEPTPISSVADVSLFGPAGEVLPRIIGSAS